MTSSSQASMLPPFALLDEPLLTFSPADPKQVDVHPLRGLVNFGPYSKAVSYTHLTLPTIYSV